jgi:hypothetical protein
MSKWDRRGMGISSSGFDPSGRSALADGGHRRRAARLERCAAGGGGSREGGATAISNARDTKTVQPRSRNSKSN